MSLIVFLIFLNIWYLAISFAPPLDIRKWSVHRSRGLGGCGLVSKLSNVTYIGCLFPRTVQYSCSRKKYRLYYPITWCESCLMTGWLQYCGCVCVCLPTRQVEIPVNWEAMKFLRRAMGSLLGVEPRQTDPIFQSLEFLWGGDEGYGNNVTSCVTVMTIAHIYCVYEWCQTTNINDSNCMVYTPKYFLW